MENQECYKLGAWKALKRFKVTILSQKYTCCRLLWFLKKIKVTALESTEMAWFIQSTS